MVDIWECQYKQHVDLEARLEKIPETYLPPFCQENYRKIITKADILRAVESDKLFGVIECNIQVSKYVHLPWPSHILGSINLS